MPYASVFMECIVSLVQRGVAESLERALLDSNSSKSRCSYLLLPVGNWNPDIFMSAWNEADWKCVDGTQCFHVNIIWNEIFGKCIQISSRILPVFFLHLFGFGHQMVDELMSLYGWISVEKLKSCMSNTFTDRRILVSKMPWKRNQTRPLGSSLQISDSSRSGSTKIAYKPNINFEMQPGVNYKTCSCWWNYVHAPFVILTLLLRFLECCRRICDPRSSGSTGPPCPATHRQTQEGDQWWMTYHASLVFQSTNHMAISYKLQKTRMIC